MKLSMALDYSGDPRAAVGRVRDLESAGVDVGWVSELYSFDAISLLGYLFASTDRIELGTGIVPVYSRTPALTAMTAAGLDAVSDGRFNLGLGASGPQVIEGWHGVPYERPLAWTRDVIEICRKVWRREPVTHDGRAHTLPLPDGEGTGLGKPLKLINHPVRDRIPIYVASLGPKNVELTAEMAEGWLPILFHPERAEDVWGEPLAQGRAGRSEDLGPLQVVAGGPLAICEPDEAARIKDAQRPFVALYVGGMGAPGENFYNDLFCRYGYEAEAAEIQRLYLDGARDEAAAAVPQSFLDATSMVGDEAQVRERVEAYRAAGVTHLSVEPAGPEPLTSIEKVKTWMT